MASRPTVRIPEWASSGTKTDPGAGKEASGWSVSEKPPAQWWNWILNALGQWVDWAMPGVADAHGTIQTDGVGGITGTTGRNFSAAISGDSIAVTFTSSLDNPPVVVATYQPTTSESTRAYFCTVHSVSSSGFTINVFDDAGTQAGSDTTPAQIVHFVAIDRT